MKLTQNQIKQYKEDGYLIINNLIDHNDIDQVVNEMKSLVEKEDLKETISVFTTNDQERKSDKYFLESGDKIRFFFEPGALKDGKLQVPKEVCFNKCGHALHDLNPVFEKFSYQQKIKDVIYSLGVLNKPLSVQSMFIFKNPKIGGEVGIHNDSTFLHTTPLTTHAIWFAFEDATTSNGCLRAMPGSHKNGITRRFIRNKTNDGCIFEGEKEGPFDLKDFVALECKKGSIILLDGSTIHYSEPNTSQQSRYAYTLHFIEGDGSAVYEADNWLQRSKELPFRVL
ncbi:hypothetical protein DLAC_05745 [Tieghemostelium lacteum]|uniref:Phytanoyl-CoA dioxygenase n=1 Tax=Tieghemostelium lacteum TaxID=361077 RepID=A0A151ZGX1_TIELA|nr:hypothetical protein DLAC_05745 [Tieghemostelium lacteum]|eukprot:KYQ93120.1 hypothetical protein DLAC_05745 [Tieghemostelium lacteum]